MSAMSTFRVHCYYYFIKKSIKLQILNRKNTISVLDAYCVIGSDTLWYPIIMMVHISVRV